MRKIRVLVVDDSVFIRRNLSRILETVSNLEVIGTATNGEEAIQQTKLLRPDVITMDVVMPVMDGLTALKIIMAEMPTPVVMLSSITQRGAQETLEALSLGAVDFITKPSGSISLDISTIRTEILGKVKTAYTSKVKIASQVDVTQKKFRDIIESLSGNKIEPVSAATRKVDPRRGRSIIAIATSTGGPAALQILLPALPLDLKAGIVIVQHIAKGFTAPLADRLDSLSQIKVRQAKAGDIITPGVALISPSDVHITVVPSNGGYKVQLKTEPSDSLHRPSADVLFNSLAKFCAGQTCAVILTGMGNDGAAGMRAIYDGGGWTIAQDEASSVIYGMPKQAVEKGGVQVSLPLQQIAANIVKSAT